MTNQEAIEILNNYKQRLEESCSNLLGNDKEAFDLAIKALEERPKGKWRKRNGYVYDHRCSCCEYIIYNEKTNYCPNCGARMESEEE